MKKAKTKYSPETKMNECKQILTEKFKYVWIVYEEFSFLFFQKTKTHH